MSDAFDIRETHARVVCVTCGCEFFIPLILNNLRIKDQKPFWCPVGHSQNYVPSPDPDPKALQARIRDLEAENRALKVDKARLTSRLDQMGVE